MDYDPDLVALARTLPGRRWDGTARIWRLVHLSGLIREGVTHPIPSRPPFQAFLAAICISTARVPPPRLNSPF
jgi:hypothetical protein